MNATKCGVWLDHREAKLIDVDGAARPDGSVHVERRESGVEDKVKHFGHRPNLPPQSDARSAGSAEEKRLDHRRAHDIKAFFTEIADEVAGAERVVILGPGQTPDELAAFLSEDRRFNDVVERVERADANLTEGEIVHRVRTALDEGPVRRRVRGSNN